MKKLEYRIIERTKLSVPYCNYCVISEEPVLDNATHELVAYHEDGSTADIGSICADCKKDFENNNLSHCELCGRLQRNRMGCYCNLLKDGKFRTSSTKDGMFQTIESHLANKTKKLENELKAAKEELNIEREEVVKFQEKSEEWSKKQKQELLDKIKEQEAQIIKLTQEIKLLKEQQNGQVAQIEVKEPKK